MKKLISDRPDSSAPSTSSTSSIFEGAEESGQESRNRILQTSVKISKWCEEVEEVEEFDTKTEKENQDHERTGKQVIYFIQNSLTFRIKIGWTGKDDVKDRLADHQTSSDALLYVLATRDGTKQTETELHKQFSAFQVHEGGEEWFNPGAELLQFIIGCAAVKMIKETAMMVVEKACERSFPETMEERRRRGMSVLNDMRAKGYRFKLQDNKFADGYTIDIHPSPNPQEHRVLHRNWNAIIDILEDELNSGGT